MTSNIVCNSVFSDLLIDISTTDELVVEKELEEEKVVKDYYLFEKKIIQIDTKVNEFNTSLYDINNTLCKVYIDILSPPPEINNYC